MSTDESLSPNYNPVTPSSPSYKVAPVLNCSRSSSSAIRSESFYNKFPDVSNPVLSTSRYNGDNCSYLEPIKVKAFGMSKIESHLWFRNVDRSGGKKLLENAKNGTYLLRPSGESGFFAVLMIKGCLKMVNIPIWYNKHADKFYLDTSNEIETRMFDTIDDLLNFFTKHDINGDILLEDNKLPSK